MFQFLNRFFGSYTAYQPGTGRILPVQLNSSSGININENSAMSIPAMFHGMRLYGQTIGAREWNLVHHLDQGKKEIARTHPVHKLLHDDPNEYQSAPEWRELMIWNGLSYGGSYSYIERNGNFRPTALWPLMSDRTKPIIRNKKLVYVTVVDGNEIDLEPYEVFHFKGFSGSAINGFPLVQLFKDTLGLTKAEEEFASKFFGNGANMGAAVMMPGALSDKARQNLKESVGREYGGLGNAFKTIFLEEGVKIEKLGVDPDAAQFIEGRTFQINEIARVLGLAPHLLYELSRSTNNNIEHQGREAVLLSFGPVANRLAHEGNRKLLYESEKDEYETIIDLAPLMQGDALSQAQVDQIDFQIGSITPDEIRAKRGRNSFGTIGGKLYVNQSFIPLETAGTVVPDNTDTTPPADPSKGIADPDGAPGPSVPSKLIDDDLNRSALRPVVRDAIERIIRRESKAVETAEKKYADDPAAYGVWLGKWEQEQRSHIADVLQPTSEAITALKGKWDASYVERHISVSRSKDWSKERIEKAVSELLGETSEPNS